MNVYQSEIEQVEAIKQWLKKYGHWLSIAILVTLFTVLGYRFWEQHVTKVTSQASERYQQLIIAVANRDENTINARAQDLLENYPNTVYANAAALIQAKWLVSGAAAPKEALPKALKKLNYVMQHSSSTTLRQIARLRAAKILETENKNQEALDLLTIVDDAVYQPEIDELKGDIYRNINDKKKSLLFYRKAQKAFDNAGITSPFLDMKMNEVEPA